MPVDRLTLTASFETMQGKYESFPQRNVLRLRPGNRRTPLGRFDLNLSWTHTGNYYASADNGKGQVAPSSSKNDTQKLIDVFNGSLGWSSGRRDLEVRLWAKT
jgi:hypothetical protein